MRPAYLSIAAAVSAVTALLLGAFEVLSDAATIELLLGSIVMAILGLRER